MTDRPDWQDAFRSQMTRVTFQLMLTRAMLEFLCATSSDVHWDRRSFGHLGYSDNWMATERALTKRGLIKRKPPTPVKRESNGLPPPWELTPVGVAVVEMLKIGGLYIEAQEAADKLQKRKGRL
jgi:hypothetical protein